MSKTNTTVSFTDAVGGQHDFPIRSILKIMPDKTSNSALFSSTIDILSVSMAHDAWLSVIVIDLPQGLPEGAGTLTLNTAAIYAGYQKNANNLQIGLNVLPGSGVSNPLAYYEYGGNIQLTDLSALEPSSQIIVRPPPGFTSADFTAVEFLVDAELRASNGEELNDNYIAIVANSNDSQSAGRPAGSHVIWDRNGDKFRVIFISSWPLMSRAMLGFSIVVNDAVDAVINESPFPTILSITYYDIDGAVITGPPIEDYSVAVELKS